jgi:hypothetical protein
MEKGKEEDLFRDRDVQETRNILLDDISIEKVFRP